VIPVSAPDALLADGRALAAAGSWRELHMVLRARATEVATSPALITLYTEALLRTGSPRDARAWLLAHEGTVVLSGDRSAVRRVANLSGAANFELGELDDAAASFERALELARADGDDLLIARATNNLAVIANIRGRHEEALSLYALALPAYQRLGNANGLAESYHNMAITFRDLRQLVRADEHELRAIEFARQATNDHLVAIALVGRAELSFRRGDVAFAEVAALRAARDFAAMSDPAREADALRLCGAARLALRKFPEAREALDSAVRLAAMHGNALIEAESRRARAELGAATGSWDEALSDAERAAALFARLEARAEHAAMEEWISVRRRSMN
jgi:tetratricopeptide (TPR) repeat protein